MDAKTFRTLGHALVDWIADYRESIGTLAVKSAVAPGDVKSHLPLSPPLEGGQSASIPELLRRVVLPGITHWNHPRFFAYFPSNTSYASVLADLVCAGLGVQGMSWQTSPAATEVEERVMDWLRQMVGLGDGWTGVIHDTASTATLSALLCARERATSMSQEGKGLQSAEAPLVVYASSESHSSVVKAVLLAGFGRSHLRLIATDDAQAMRVSELRRAIEEDESAGLRPCAVVATVGTTATTAVDPIAELAALTRAHALWLHVDAAMAGSAMILPEARAAWQGIEDADSLVFNPHKWLGAGFDLSAYYCKDTRLLRAVMGTNPSYLQTAEDEHVVNYRDWHIPLGRRFRALKLWFLLLDEGVVGLQARLRRDLDNARWLGGQVEAAPPWTLMAPVSLQTVCLRHAPAGWEESRVAAHNLAIAARLNDSGRAYLTPAVVKGRQLLRVSIGAERTERADVVALWHALQEAAEPRA